VTVAATVRRAAGPDLTGLVALEAGFPEGDRFSRRTWRRLLNGRNIAHVAEAEGRVVGAAVILLRQGLDIGRLYSLSVAPSARGQGLARRLLAAGEAAAMAAGCTRMRLEVRTANKAAIALYESVGYRLFEHIHGYYPDGEPAARMQKLLDAAQKENI
jgi:[ribosomal protein S18]-alanine N-acetyltransferase